MEQKGKFYNQLSEAPLDLRAPIFTKVRKGGWWLRLITLVVSDCFFLSVAEILSGYSLASSGKYSTYSSIVSVILIQVVSLFIQDTYKPGKKRIDYGNIVKTLVFAHGLIVFFHSLFEPQVDIPRSVLLNFLSLSILFICIGRFLVDVALNYLRRHKILGRNSVFIISSLEDHEDILFSVKKEKRYNISGVATSDALDRKNRQQTLEKINELGITEVFISWRAIKDRMYLCWLFQAYGITVHLLPTEFQPIYRDLVIYNVGGMACLSFVCPIITGKDFWIKRCFDFCFTAIFLMITFPVYVAIAIIIKLDSPGPIFYRQTRIGLSGKQFKVWKFRTMVPNADKLQKELESLNEVKDGVIFKIKDDPRVTQIGKLLRRYSLDELPQLFNVLLGEMSLVGPRPLPTRDVDKFSARHFIRQEVLPGVTGLWQVSGRSDILDFEQIIKLDLNYIENWSLWLDFQILFRTVKVVLKKEGAY
jgi:exopolysaccharide biosynthesis polyprenyl glycosylphosphotransferase